VRGGELGDEGGGGGLLASRGAACVEDGSGIGKAGALELLDGGACVAEGVGQLLELGELLADNEGEALEVGGGVGGKLAERLDGGRWLGWRLGLGHLADVDAAGKRNALEVACFDATADGACVYAEGEGKLFGAYPSAGLYLGAGAGGSAAGPSLSVAGVG